MASERRWGEPKETRRSRDKCLGPEVAYQSLRLFSVELRHGDGVCRCCQGNFCATVIAGRGLEGDWSAQIRRGRDKRELVSRVSCTCDGGRLFWATLAGIRGVGHLNSSLLLHMKGGCWFLVLPDSGRRVWFGFGAPNNMCASPPGNTCSSGLSAR